MMLDRLLLQPNTFLNAHHLKSKLRLQPLNINKLPINSISNASPASSTSASLDVLHSSNATNQLSATRISPIFLNFPDNSAGWLVHSPDQPQSLIVTRDAYFDEGFNSALCFDSKPFAGTIPIRSHFNPNGLYNSHENSEPLTYHQTGSASNLGNPPCTLSDDTTPFSSLNAIPEASDDNDVEDKLPDFLLKPNSQLLEHDDSNTTYSTSSQLYQPSTQTLQTPKGDDYILPRMQ